MSDIAVPGAPVASRRSNVLASASERTTMLDASVVVVSCLLFLGIALYQIQLPGLYTDEAFDVVPAMQLLLGHPVELQRNIGLHIFGVTLPLMSSSDYQGVTSTYLVLPFFALGGINVVSLRLMTITVGVIGVVLTYFLARAWFGRSVARLAVVLIAVSPAWIFWSRLGVYVVSQVMPIAVGSLLAFTAWLAASARSKSLVKRNGVLYLASLLLGLGLTTKLLFIWFIVAVAITAAVVWGRPAWDMRRDWLAEKSRWIRTGIMAAIWFAIGAGPFLLYNILSGGTFQLLRHTLTTPGTTSNGVSNSALLRNLWTEADSFRALLDGSYFWFQGVSNAAYANPLTPTLFAISAVGLIVILIADHVVSRFDLSRLRIEAVAALGASVLIALVLASGLVHGNVASLVVILTGLLCLAGTILVARSGLRDSAAWSSAAWFLLGTCVLSGACWWFLGAGRPDGPAPGVLLGLWPVDSAGVVFWSTGAGLVVLMGWDAHPARLQRPVVATLALIGLIVAQSAVTVSGLWSTHLLVLLPLPQLAIAAFAVLAAHRLAALVKGRELGPRIRRYSFVVALVFVGLIVLFDLKVDRDYQRDLAVTGGSATFSDAIYSLATYLDDRPPQTRVVALDWGFKRPVQLLTDERVNPDEAYGYESPASAATIQTIDGLVTQPGTLFLFHTPEAGIAYPRFDIFEAAAHAAGKQTVLQRTFYQRNGVPVYQVYSVH